jgi:hypothetical protein
MTAVKTVAVVASQDVWRVGVNNARVVIGTGLALLVLVFASGMALTEETEPARGAELLAPLKKDLKQALMAGMQKSPVHAISACKDQAPAITNALAVEGIRIGRTSHRLRNPGNTAPEWADIALKTYLSDDTDRAPRVVSLADNREGYVEPITIKPLCLACHGDNLAPDVAAQIQVMYPEDEATGFELDDLRGVYWVEYPAAMVLE